MDPASVKLEALKLPLLDRLGLAQALIASFYPQVESHIIDREELVTDDPDFEVDPDPVVTVETVTGAPRRIEIGGTEGPTETRVHLSNTAPVNEAFQKLRDALGAQTST